MRVFLLFLLVLLFASACARVHPELRPYRDAPAQQLVAQVDENVYSPLTANLRSLEAELFIDISGFYGPDERPDEPVWVPGTFSWADGSGEFTVTLTPELAPLEPHLHQALQGKEEDLINRPFSERIQEEEVRVQTRPDGLLEIVARTPGEEEWRLAVNEDFLVPHVTVRTPQLAVESEIFYDDARPARISRIQSRYLGEEQQTRVNVEIHYQMVDGYAIPHVVAYTGSVDAVQFPPFRLRLENVRITGAGNR